MTISKITRDRKERGLRQTRRFTIKKRCVKSGIFVGCPGGPDPRALPGGQGDPGEEEDPRRSGKPMRKFHPPSASPADGGFHAYEVCWIAERRHAPGPTGRVKVQNSSNLTGTVSLPERTFPALSVV